MVAAILVILITIICVSQFYLKNNALTSFVTAISALLGMLFAFNFYELLGGLLLQKGYIPSSANGICFLLLFGICFALFRTLSGLIVGSSIEFGTVAKTISAVVFGVITAVIISGCLLIALNMASATPKLSYKRFEDPITQSSINTPKKSLLFTDDLTASLFGSISKGSLSGKKSFAVYHADFVNQLHLSKHKAKDGVLPVSASGAISIPKHGVRKKETKDGDPYTAIRLEIDTSKIDKGGASDKNGQFSFTLYQIRLICKASGDSGTTGAASKVIYPEANLTMFMDNKPVNTKQNYSDSVELTKDHYTIVKNKKKVVMDLAFKIPSGMKPVLVEFKNTAVAAVPAMTTAEDAEKQLNAIFKKEK